MKTKKAVYGGSFDPLTKGHVWLIQRAVGLFDQMTIVIAVNADKDCFLSLEERKKNIQAFLKTMDSDHCQIDVKVVEEQYLVQYSHSIKAGFLIRGLRSQEDFGYEYIMNQVNRAIAPSIESIYLVPPSHLAHVSSSMVRSLVNSCGWEKVVSQYVTKDVLESIQKRESL